MPFLMPTLQVRTLDLDPLQGAPNMNARTYEPWGPYFVVHIWRKMETTVLKQSWTWTLKRICLIYVQ